MCLSWLKLGIIVIDNQEIFKLQKKHSHQILAVLFQTSKRTIEFKIGLLDEVTGDDKSDIAVNTRAKCMAGLPDHENKALVW